MASPSGQREYRSKASQARYDRAHDMLQQMTVLPTSIHVPLRIMEMYRSPKSPGLDAFAQVLVADAALSAKVLQLANSAWFSRTRNITRISDALRVIGLKNLMPLLFGMSLAGIYSKFELPSDERAALWRGALLKGVLAREYAAWHGVAEHAEEAFLCGVLQDMALPVLYACDRAAAMELAGVVDLVDDNTRCERERSLYGTDHAELGREICTMLQLPELFITATGTHHRPGGPLLPPEFADLATALQVAAAIRHSTARLDDQAAGRACGTLLAPADRLAFIEHASRAAKDMITLLGTVRGEGAKMKAFLREVSDQIAATLISVIGTSNQTIEQLQEAQTELESKVRELGEQVIRAEHDALTGVLNRGGFLVRAGKMLALARKLQMACVVGFIDMNNFKAVNDTHGHAVGDQALATLAKALKGTIGNRGIIGRCGGDEFAFILLVPTSVGPQAVASDVEGTLADLRIATPAGELKVSSSVGVTWLGVPGESQTVEDALKAADEQMYAAKRVIKAQTRAA